MSGFGGRRSFVDPSEGPKRDWLRYFLRRNKSKTPEDVETRLDQFGYNLNEISQVFKVAEKMLDPSAYVRRDAYYRVEKIPHRVSLSAINARNPNNDTGKNLIEFMLEKLPRDSPTIEAFWTEAKEFLLDIGLPGWTSEEAIDHLLETHIPISVPQGDSPQAAVTPQHLPEDLPMAGMMSTEVSELSRLIEPVSAYADVG